MAASKRVGRMARHHHGILRHQSLAQKIAHGHILKKPYKIGVAAKMTIIAAEILVGIDFGCKHLLTGGIDKMIVETQSRRHTTCHRLLVAARHSHIEADHITYAKGLEMAGDKTRVVASAQGHHHRAVGQRERQIGKSHIHCLAQGGHCGGVFVGGLA